MIDARQESVDLPHEQVGFKRMTRAAAGHGAQRGVCPAADRFHPLRRPQKKRELQKRHGLLRVNARTATLAKDVRQITRKRQGGKIAREGNRVAVRRHGRLGQRRLRQTQLLVGFKILRIWIVAAHTHHKAAVFKRHAALQFLVEHGAFSFSDWYLYCNILDHGCQRKRKSAKRACMRRESGV